jgi:hypothetical protein
MFKLIFQWMLHNKFVWNQQHYSFNTEVFADAGGRAGGTQATCNNFSLSLPFISLPFISLPFISLSLLLSHLHAGAASMASSAGAALRCGAAMMLLWPCWLLWLLLLSSDTQSRDVRTCGFAN